MGWSLYLRTSAFLEELFLREEGVELAAGLFSLTREFDNFGMSDRRLCTLSVSLGERSDLSGDSQIQLRIICGGFLTSGNPPNRILISVVKSDFFSKGSELVLSPSIPIANVEKVPLNSSTTGILDEADSTSVAQFS